MVAVYLVALFVDGKAAVSVAVKGEADVKAVVDNELLEIMYMRRAAVDVDVQSVRLVCEHVCVRAEGVEHALCHLPSAAVGAVKADPASLVGARREGDEVAYVAVASGGVVHRAADLLTLGVGQLLIGVEVFLDLIEQGLFHLLALAVEELYAVVVIRVVACGDHNAAVKIIRARDVGHARRGGDVQQVRVRAGGGKPRAERRFKHIARAAGVLADNDLCPVRFAAVVPAEVAANAECVVDCQIYVCFPAEAVSSEIFTHCFLLN